MQMNVILYDYKLYFIMQQGRNALHIACQCGANETVLYLLNNKAITDINAKTLVIEYLNSLRNRIRKMLYFLVLKETAQ